MTGTCKGCEEKTYIIEYINCLFKYEETGKFERPKTIIWELI